MKNRTKLEEAIPLDTPMVCHIELTNVCNFRCAFCATLDDKYCSSIPKGMMSYTLFTKIVDDLSKFPKKIKRVSFHVAGEPLLNPRAIDMIDYIKRKNIVEQLVLFTNGSKLTHELSQKLINTGIDCIQISIEHVSSDGYKKIVGVDLDYDGLLENIRYISDYNKSVGGNTKIFCKILDVGLTDEEKAKFYKDFRGYVDDCYIEHLLQTLPDSSNRDTTLGRGEHFTQGGLEIVPKQVCTAPFYVLGTQTSHFKKCLCTLKNQ
ncbi:MAG: radical SAM protein [Lachnospiraceae bacterium]|nr:radical SAM protein [Lachnospiraceae bacterium]